jgi:hypothetical protein
MMGITGVLRLVGLLELLGMGYRFVRKGFWRSAKVFELVCLRLGFQIRRKCYAFLSLRLRFLRYYLDVDLAFVGVRLGSSSIPRLSSRPRDRILASSLVTPTSFPT